MTLAPRPLLLSTSDRAGGGGRAAYRLHQALRASGLPSRLIVARETAGGAGIAMLPDRATCLWHRLRSPIERRLDGAIRNDDRAFHASRLPTGFGRYLKSLNDVDLFHLHWINDLLGPEDLIGVTFPVVWTLHDIWPFTGGCHYAGCCHGFTRECGNCPLLKRPGERDASALLMKRKRRALARLPITLVAPSSWIAGEASRSSLFADTPVHVIPNAVDTRVFRPGDRASARQRLGLPDAHGRTLLFSAVSPLVDPRKGWNLLTDALERLAADPRAMPLDAIILGGEAGYSLGPGGIPLYSLGRIEDESLVAAAYCAADVTVVPSREENLANVIAESLACGRPCVGFAIGGNGDLIVDGETGYLARPFDTGLFADAVIRTLVEPGWDVRCRTAAEHKVAYPVIARAHRLIYEQMLHGTPGMAGGI